MPRWTSICKKGEQPSEFYEGREFEKRFDIKTGFGPEAVVNGKKVRVWNRAWSDVPYEWAESIDWLLGKIRSKYRVETLDDDSGDPGIQVFVDQIKVKFGSLRFYYSLAGNIENMKLAEKQIDRWVKACEKKLAKADPYYGVPY